ncbi:MAG: DUF177 domain-containing protein [Streptosporangiales bacterium]|nr:DUF177 domain-containing protein [Streptosporangiales bacterium]
MTYGSRNPLTSLDPRDPFVVDTRPLGRSPGSMRRISRTVPAPADLGAGMVGVPKGSELELDIRLEAVMEGVLVSGTVRVPLTGECARCLEPLDYDVEAEFQELFVYDPEDATEDDHRLESDMIALEPVVRDAVVLTLPLSPLCRDDCPGLCPVCGARLAVAGPEHDHDEQVDPRWARLFDLKNTTDQEHDQEG